MRTRTEARRQGEGVREGASAGVRAGPRKKEREGREGREEREGKEGKGKGRKGREGGEIVPCDGLECDAELGADRVEEAVYRSLVVADLIVPLRHRRLQPRPALVARARARACVRACQCLSLPLSLFL